MSGDVREMWGDRIYSSTAGSSRATVTECASPAATARERRSCSQRQGCEETPFTAAATARERRTSTAPSSPPPPAPSSPPPAAEAEAAEATEAEEAEAEEAEEAAGAEEEAEAEAEGEAEAEAGAGRAAASSKLAARVRASKTGKPNRCGVGRNQ